MRAGGAATGGRGSARGSPKVSVYTTHRRLVNRNKKLPESNPGKVLMQGFNEVRNTK